MKHFQKFFFASAVLFLFSSSLFSSTLKLSGFVYDKSTGKPIPDANVIIKNTNLGTASQSNGYYFIENLAPGAYSIAVSVIGYKKVELKNVDCSKSRKLDFRLQPKVIRLDPVIVTATLSEHKQSQVTTSAEVLTTAKLKKITATTAAEAIESVGGLYIKNYDGFAGVLSPSIRGSNTNQVVVLLDGVRLNTGQGGGVDLNAFPVSALGTIEVVRGGHSALLGGDAVGGAIHLMSRQLNAAMPLALGFQSTIGSFGTREFNGFGAQRLGKFSYLIDFNHAQSEGNFNFKLPDSGAKATRENNDYKGDNLFFKSGFNFNSGNKLQLILHGQNSKKGIAGSVALNPWSGAPMTTPNARAENERRLVSLLSDNQISDRLRVQSNVFLNKNTFHYINPDGWTPTDDTHKNTSLGLNLRGIYYLSQTLKVQTGLEQRVEKLSSTKFTVNDRKILGAFAQLEISRAFSFAGKTAQLTLIPAIRHDNYSDVGAENSPKLGLLLSTGENVNFTLKGNVGKSFRAPSFDDLYWPDDGYTRGNPNLKPETATSWDAGFVLQNRTASFWEFEMSYFNQQVKDLIGWGPDETGVWLPLNTGKAKISGVETGVKLQPLGQSFYINIFHTYMKATDETENSPLKGKWLIYRPKNKLDITSGVKFGKLSANIDYRLVSKRYTKTDNSASLEKYSLLNGNIGYSIALFKTKVSAKLQLLNILNKSIYLNEGYPLPGREFRFVIGLER